MDSTASFGPSDAGASAAELDSTAAAAAACDQSAVMADAADGAADSETGADAADVDSGPTMATTADETSGIDATVSDRVMAARADATTVSDRDRGSSSG